MGRKGATLVFEQVMLFMIGVVIFLACFSIFRSYEYHFTQSIMSEQLEEVSDLITSEIIGFSGDDTFNHTVRISVPERIGNENYRINLTQRGLNITTLISGKSFFSPLSRINRSFAISGAFSTVHGSEFMIYKRGSQIIIG